MLTRMGTTSVGIQAQGAAIDSGLLRQHPGEIRMRLLAGGGEQEGWRETLEVPAGN
jgi:hypothetical protein